jgi:uncharacterized C2H2 Zn-finger protein
MPRRRVPGRSLSLICPRCGQLVRLNWRRSRKAPQTIQVWVHPYKGTPTEVTFNCPQCKYVVSLGDDHSQYDVPAPTM